ncbi:MAG: hypothetical protein JSV79_04440 [Armatimonadota bacterium]|nr:MAG: hypothetical protein JSV79_04440 [Armatimonadota bacterium]
MTSERHDKELADLLKAARALPRAGARQKAVSAMATAAGSRRWSSISWRRPVLAAAFVVLLLASGLWLLPKRHTVALADVARAMASVQSAHFVVWTGQQPVGELWVKGPEKCLIRAEGGLDAADDGQRTISLERRGGPQLLAVVQPARSMTGLGELSEGMTYLDWLSGPGLTHSVLETGGAKMISTEEVALPDGRRAVNVTLAVPTPSGPTPEKMVITVDPDTDLVIAWERFIAWERAGEGHGGLRVDRIDYDVEVPDSLFSLDIPTDAVVVDLLTPPSDGLTAKGQALAKEAEAMSADVIFDGGPDHSHGGSCGTSYHTNLRFQFLDRNATSIYYLPDRNTYCVAGRVLALTSDSSGFSQVVEDDEFVPPALPDSTPDQMIAKAESALSPESIAERDAWEKQLRAAGAVALSKVDGGMATCGTGYHPGMFFRSADKSGFRLYYFPDRNVYYVMGKALVWAADFEEVVEDAEVPAPGEPERLP